MPWFMSIIDWVVGSKVGRAVGYVLGVILSIVGLIQLGKKLQRKEQKTEDLKGYIETKRKADEVPVNTDRESAIARLRSKNFVRRGD